MLFICCVPCIFTSELEKTNNYAQNSQSYVYIDIIPTCFNGHVIIFRGYKVLQVPKHQEGYILPTCIKPGL
jgi:hypothetical protein